MIVVFIAEEIAKVDRLIAKTDAVSRSLAEYRQALITAAVTGRIDVREAV